MTPTTTARRGRVSTFGRRVGSFAALAVIAATGAVGLSAATAAEEPLPLLTAEPAEGAMPEPGTIAPGDWAVFRGTGSCPSGTNTARAWVDIPAHPNGGTFLGSAGFVGTAQVQAVTDRSWTALRNDPADGHHFAEPNSYRLTLRCGTLTTQEDQWPDQPEVAEGLLTFDDDGWRVTNADSARPTVVHLAVTADGDPVEVVPAGTEVVVTAAVTPAEATGDVELFNTNTGDDPHDSLGTAEVDDGAATFTLDDLAPEDYVLQAVFTPDDTEAFEESDLSAAVPLTVEGGDAETTTTTLTVSPESPVEVGAEVTLTAEVSPAQAAGSVRFNASGEQVAEPVPLDGGSATLTTTDLPEGALTLTATFLPADEEAFATSTSTPVSYTVGDPGPKVTATDADGNVLGENPELQDGQVVTLTAPGYEAEEDVVVTLDATAETPEELGTVAADEDGAAAIEFTATGMAPGQHQLNFVGAASGLDILWEFQIAGEGDDDGGEEDGAAGGDASGDAGGAAGGDASGGAGGAGGGGDASGGPLGNLAETGAFIVGPALLLGLATMSGGYAMLRRSRRDDLLTFDEP